MTQLLLWFIMSYGLMNIMVYGSIFQGLRDRIKKWGENENAPLQSVGEFISGILSCPMCFQLGVDFSWVGLFIHRCKSYWG